MSPSRIRTLALLIPAVVAALALLSWTQIWIVLELDGGDTVAASGSTAAAAVPALALAGLALIAALVLAGPIFRVTLGLLQVFIGAAIATSALLALADPVRAGASAVTVVTGVDGDASVRALVSSADVSAWVALCLIAGAFGVLGGLVIAITARRWPHRTRRYEAARWADSDAEGEPDRDPDRFGEWDALSDGSDPTAR